MSTTQQGINALTASTGQLNNSIGATATRTANARTQLRSLTQQLQQLQPGTAQFNAMSIAAADLRDTIDDTNAVIKATTGNAVENLATGLSKTAQIGIAGFQGIASAQALFGKQSEDVNKALLKLQALAGLSSAIKSLGDLGQQITEIRAALTGFLTRLGLTTTATTAQTAATTAQTVATTAQTTATGANSVATVAQTTATNGATVAQRILNATMKASPIFLLIAVIAAVVLAYKHFSSETESSAEAQERLNNAMVEAKKNLESYNKFIQESRSLDNKIKELNKTTELINAEEKLNDIIRNRPNDLKSIRSAQEEVNSLTIENSKNNSKSILDEFDLEIKLTKDKLKNNKQYYTEAQAIRNRASVDEDLEAQISAQKIVNDLADQNLELERTLSLSTKKRENLVIELNNEIIQVTNEAGNKIDDIDKKVNEELRKRAKETADQIIKAKESQAQISEDFDEEYLKETSTNQENEIREVQDKYFRLITLAEQDGKDTKKLIEKQAKEEKEINEKYKGETDKLLKDANEIRAQEEEEITERISKAKKTAVENEIQDIEDEYFELIEKAKKYNLSTVDLEKERDKKIQDIKKASADLDKEKDKEKLEALKKTAMDIQDVFRASLTGTFSEINLAFAGLQDTLFGEEGIFGEEGFFKKLKEGSVDALDGIQIAIETITSALSSFSDAQLEKTLYNIEEETRQSQETLDNQLSDRILSEEEYAVKSKRLKDDADAKDKQARQKAFKQQKQLAIINAVIQTAQGVLAAFSSGVAVPIIGPATGAIYAGIAGALGAAQIAIISQQEFRAARGGVVPGSGPGNVDSVPSLLAPGEMVINAKSSAIYGNLLSEINQAGGGIALAPKVNSTFTGGSTGFNNAGNGGSNNNITVEVQANVLETGVTQAQTRMNRIRRNKEYFGSNN